MATTSGTVSLSVTGSKELKRATRILQLATGKFGVEFVVWRARIVNFDLIKSTPPCGPEPSKESFREQRQRGMKNILRDVVKLFPQLSLPHILTNAVYARAAKYFERYIDGKNLHALAKMLMDFGIPMPVVLEKATEEAHQAARNDKGRVKAGARIPVLDRSSIIPLIRKLYKDVGKMKHGWSAAAKHLGVKGVPAWVMTQFAPEGHFQDDLDKPGNPSFTIISNAKGIQRMGPMVQHMLAINERKMLIEARAKLPSLTRKFGTASRITYGI